MKKLEISLSIRTSTVTVQILGLATVSIQTSKRQGNTAFERYQILLKKLSRYFGHSFLLQCPIDLISNALERRLQGIQLCL